MVTLFNLHDGNSYEVAASLYESLRSSKERCYSFPYLPLVRERTLARLDDVCDSL
jgi:hypothetical protein